MKALSYMQRFSPIADICSQLERYGRHIQVADDIGGRIGDMFLLVMNRSDPRAVERGIVISTARGFSGALATGDLASTS